MTSLRSILYAVLAWPTESQHQSRRNAMVAATALARRRREREDVEAYLDEHARTSERPARRDVI